MGERKWIKFAALGVGVLLAATVTLQLQSSQAQAMEAVVYKSPTCGCCSKWVDHLRANGFNVVTEDVEDLQPIKARYGVTSDLVSCHTAVIDGYVMEGHVPADVIQRFLAERPNAAGLAVPGMPMGSPGMEGPRSDRYNIIAFGNDGARSIYASR